MADAATGRPVPARAWLIWILALAFFFYGWVHRMAPSAMIDELMAAFRVGGALLGTLAGLYFWAYAAMQLPVGVLVDRLGPRAILTVAAVVAGAGSLLFSTGGPGDGLWPAYIGRAMIGAGAGVSFVCVLALAAAWLPSTQFGLLSGLTMLGGMLGGISGQLPVAAMVEAVGWSAGMAGFGLAGIGLAAVIWLVVRDHPPEATRPPAVGEPVLSGLARVLRRPQSWLAGLFGLCLSAQIFLFAGLWGVPYLQLAFGVGRDAATFATSMLLLCWGVGAPAFGWLGDRTGRRRRLMLAGATGTLVLWTVILFGPALSFAATVALFVPLGLAAGSMLLAYPLSRVHNPDATGAAMGVTNMAVMLAGAIFQPLAGWLLDLAWDGTVADGARVYSLDAYHTAFLLLPAAGLAAILTALLVRDHRQDAV